MLSQRSGDNDWLIFQQLKSDSAHVLTNVKNHYYTGVRQGFRNRGNENVHSKNLLACVAI